MLSISLEAEVSSRRKWTDGGSRPTALFKHSKHCSAYHNSCRVRSHIPALSIFQTSGQIDAVVYERAFWCHAHTRDPRITSGISELVLKWFTRWTNNKTKYIQREIIFRNIRKGIWSPLESVERYRRQSVLLYNYTTRWAKLCFVRISESGPKAHRRHVTISWQYRPPGHIPNSGLLGLQCVVDWRLTQNLHRTICMQT